MHINGAANKEHAMLETIIDVCEFNARSLESNVVDIPAEKMCHQPPALPNHPAWHVGHLTQVRVFIAQLLGAPVDVPESWPKLFQPGTEPTADASKYPEKDELISTFKRTHRATMDAMRAAGPDKLTEPHGSKALSAIGPTIGHAVAFLIASHDWFHIGQLADWRRAMGMAR